ncbi:mitochondrial uncoupling protein 3-like isoform X4 [Catharus ustulatus]|uniref:mitochondrial uncoupling protein 3-like isoform X4 n=1 Tax=Catharus ustulatus TaxID=91951 RepID=UPI00140CA7BD|nr:mitochondrial uncoupling protein 3-like isoform X4 [Catharus ustulatus]
MRNSLLEQLALCLWPLSLPLLGWDGRCRSALEPGRKTRQEPAGEECRCQAALSGARGLEQRWLQGVRSTGSRSCASPSATMVGLKPPEVPPTITMKFISAGMAGCIADLCTFPLDTAKVRLQIQGEVRIPRTISSVEYRGVLGTLSTMVRTEGARSLYRGLAAGLQRQMGFSSISIGLYDPVKQLYTPKGAENTGVGTRILAGCTTGAVAVACAQPTDVVKVRFQASAALSDSAPRYSSTVDAYRTIAREEGIRGLWRGTLPNIARNVIINCGELVTYDIIKDALLRAQLMADNVPCHFVAAFGAGFCATVVASPVDVVKTRYMNSSPGQYSNVLSCLLALLTQDGPAGLYKGAIVLALRVTPVKLTFSITFGAPNNFPLISNYSDPAGAGDKSLALHGQGSRPVSESQHGPDVLDMVDVLIEGSDGFDEAIGFSLSEDMIIQTFPFSAVVPAALEARNILLLQSENGTGR